MEEMDEQTVSVWVESGRPFTLRLSRDGEVATSDPEWVTVSSIGDKSVLVVVSGSPTPQSSTEELTIRIPPGACVSVPRGMSACNLAVETGLTITER